jgi:hypothetical protein
MALGGSVFDMKGNCQAAFLNGIDWNLLKLCIARWLFWRARQAG